MAKIIRSSDCGNSPKNKTVEDIAVGVEMRDTASVATFLDPGATWTFPGGSEASAEAIAGLLDELDKPAALTIDHVMSHGKFGAVNGYTKRGKSEQRFCHVIAFTSAKCNKVRRIDSYCG